MSLSADEQRELAETFREELEADHERRVAKVREREDREAARRARAFCTFAAVRLALAASTSWLATASS